MLFQDCLRRALTLRKKLTRRHPWISCRGGSVAIIVRGTGVLTKKRGEAKILLACEYQRLW